ncbi:TALD3 protein, partial [Amia calva]|nr:TALD3 protein [Amia calva]
MSVAQEEEPVSLVSRPPAAPRAPTPPPRSQTRPVFMEAPPPPTPTSSTDDSSSGLSITETDTAGRNISEGEILFSYGQMVAARALAEGGLLPPNLSASLSSSLHGFQDMDYDPPSEGQVIRRPHVPHHRDPVLSLLAKMNQGLLAPQDIHYHPQVDSDSDGSAGEVSEGQRPRLTVAGETVLTGHSVLLDRGSLSGPGDELVSDGRGSSPGQLSREPGIASGGTMSVSELADQPRPRPRTRPITTQLAETHNGQQASEAPRDEAGAAPLIVRPYEGRDGDLEDGETPDDADQISLDPRDYFGTGYQGTAARSPVKMSVRLPPTQEEEGSASSSTMGGDTDSSGTDIF